MMSFVWGGLSLVFAVVLLLVTLLLGIGGGVVYAMLSGSIIGVAASIFALTKGIATHRAAFLMLASIVGSAVSWLGSLILLAVTTVKLYSDTAIAFDLMIGIVGAVSASYFLIGRYAGAGTQQPT